MHRFKNTMFAGFSVRLAFGLGPDPSSLSLRPVHSGVAPQIHLLSDGAGSVQCRARIGAQLH